MIRVASCFALCLLGALILMSFASASAAEKVLRHVVMYKFKDDVTPSQLQEVIDAFAGLPKKVDTIIGFEHGTNVSNEGKSEGFTHVFVVTFKNEKPISPRTSFIRHTRRTSKSFATAARR